VAAAYWLDSTKPVKRVGWGGNILLSEILKFPQNIIINNLRSRNIGSSQNILFIKMKTSKLSNYF
jgi:hypothetical protein